MKRRYLFQTALAGVTALVAPVPKPLPLGRMTSADLADAYNGVMVSSPPIMSPEEVKALWREAFDRFENQPDYLAS